MGFVRSLLPAPRSPYGWAPALVALVAALAYANALRNGFVLDDHILVQRNPQVHTWAALWKAWGQSWWPAALKQGGQYRPLGTVTFALDWMLSGGSARWLHAMNVVWHVVAAVAVWMLAAELLAPAAALAAALFFAVHPVHVEAVSNLVGRLEPMAAAFAIFALLAHRRGLRWQAPLCFALALASKESAVVFVALAVANDILLGPRAEGRGPSDGTPSAPGRGRSALAALRERRWLYASYVALTGIYSGTLFALFHGQRFHVTTPTFIGATTTQRLLTEATIVPHYVRLMLVPLDLSADYYPQVIRLVSGVTPAALLGGLLVFALGYAVRRAWRPAPELAFALLWVPIALAPVSNIVVAVVALAERTLYLPSVGVAIAMGWLFQWAVLRDGMRQLRPVLAAAAALLVFCAARTWLRTPVWKDDKAYLLTLLRDHPESYRGHVVAGRVLADRGDLAGAAREYALARTLFGNDPSPYFEGAAVALGAGQVKQAVALADSSVRVVPRSPAAHLLRADAHFAAGDYAVAAAAARTALALAPDSARAHLIIGIAAARMGNLPLAAASFGDGVRRHPESWELRVGYADALLITGDTVAARAEAERAVALSGNAPVAVGVLARARRNGL